MGCALCINMSKHHDSISVDSWPEAVKWAGIESARTRSQWFAVAYQERNSPDGMNFYEACNAAGLAMLQEHYKVIIISSTGV